jgi:hypothetical protein
VAREKLPGYFKEGVRIGRIVIDPHDPNTVFAAANPIVYGEKLVIGISIANHDNNQKIIFDFPKHLYIIPI